jgi:hypothetical protein
MGLKSDGPYKDKKEPQPAGRGPGKRVRRDWGEEPYTLEKQNYIKKNLL